MLQWIKNLFSNSKCTLLEGTLTRSTDGSAGYDLHTTERVVIQVGCSYRIPTGVRVAINKGYEGKVRGRSGLTHKEDTLVPTGTIDSDYRGYIGVKMWNLSKYPIILNVGDRVAQLVIGRHYDIKGATHINEERKGGFGSSGK